MSFLARLSAARSALFGQVQSLDDHTGWLVRAVGGGKTNAGTRVNEQGALGNAAVWACTTLIADVISMLPVDVLRREGKKQINVSDHPVARLLNHATNLDMSAAVFRNSLQMHLLLWGNAYAEIERTRGGELNALYPLLPDRTYPEVKAVNNGRAISYQTNIDARSINLRPDRVVHVKGYSLDGICGISPIQTLRESLGLSLALEEFAAKFFGNDAKSGGFLSTPAKLSDKAIENIRKSFSEEGQGGLSNAHKPKVLEGDFKWLPTTTSPEASQFIGSREFQLAEAARMYRVPLVLLQSLQGSTVWGTGIESLMIGFVRWTLQPWFTRWEQELARKLLTEAERQSGHYIRFNFKDLLRGDSKALAALFQSGITNGWLTPNEARVDTGRDPLPGLDEPRIQRNMQLLSDAKDNADNAEQANETGNSNGSDGTESAPDGGSDSAGPDDELGTMGG